MEVIDNQPLVPLTTVGGDAAMVSSWGNLMTERLVGEQLHTVDQIDQLPTPNNVIQQVPGPTGANPATVSYPGDYGFIVKFNRLSDNIKNKSWDVSKITFNLSS